MGRASIKSDCTKIPAAKGGSILNYYRWVNAKYVQRKKSSEWASSEAFSSSSSSPSPTRHRSTSTPCHAVCVLLCKSIICSFDCSMYQINGRLTHNPAKAQFPPHCRARLVGLWRMPNGGYWVRIQTYTTLAGRLICNQKLMKITLQPLIFCTHSQQFRPTARWFFLSSTSR